MRPATLLLAITLVPSAPLCAQIPAGMEQCEFPPRLLCPNTKLDLPGGGIPGLCKRLIDAGVVSAEACRGFVEHHTCAELLDAQVRGDRRHGGNCYGILARNCCPEPVRADVTLQPVMRDDREPSGLAIFVSGEKLTEPVRSHRRQFTLAPNAELTVLWVDASEKFNIPGADLDWEVHGIVADGGRVKNATGGKATTERDHRPPGRRH